MILTIDLYQLPFGLPPFNALIVVPSGGRGAEKCWIRLLGFNSSSWIRFFLSDSIPPLGFDSSSGIRFRWDSIPPSRESLGFDSSSWIRFLLSDSIPSRGNRWDLIPPRQSLWNGSEQEQLKKDRKQKTENRKQTKTNRDKQKQAKPR